MMIDSNKIFIDISPFIYLLKDHEIYGDLVANFIQNTVKNGVLLTTSVITYEEFCVKPYQLGKTEVIKAFEQFLQELDIISQEITLLVADTAAKWRSKYQGLRSMDALQISTAIHTQCDQFITNDKRLKQIQEIEVILINEWYH